ncbi:MAG: ferrochelatase [Polyangiaceae bacterium]
MERAVLLVSHGTVDRLDDLPGFVTNVRRGRPPSVELIAELRRRYEAIGGQSPLNATNELLAHKLERRLGVPVAWANRLWKPLVRDALSGLARAGAKRVAVVPLAQHSAQIYEDDARQAAEGTGIELVCAANWGRMPALGAAFAERVSRALVLEREVSRACVVMTAHSLPRFIIERGDPYEDEVRAAAAIVESILRGRFRESFHATVAFQSQGMEGPGGRTVEWLGPDLGAVLDEAKARGDRSVVLAPIGFLADHVEILYDLDIEARAMAHERGLVYSRAASLNADDDFVEVLVEVAAPLLRG